MRPGVQREQPRGAPGRGLRRGRHSARSAPHEPGGRPRRRGSRGESLGELTERGVVLVHDLLHGLTYALAARLAERADEQVTVDHLELDLGVAVDLEEIEDGLVDNDAQAVPHLLKPLHARPPCRVTLITWFTTLRTRCSRPV